MYTVSDIVNATHLTRYQVRRRIDSGKLKATLHTNQKSGKAYLIEDEEAKRFIRENTNNRYLSMPIRRNYVSERL